MTCDTLTAQNSETESRNAFCNVIAYLKIPGKTLLDPLKIENKNENFTTNMKGKRYKLGNDTLPPNRPLAISRNCEPINHEKRPLCAHFSRRKSFRNRHKKKLQKLANVQYASHVVVTLASDGQYVNTLTELFLVAHGCNSRNSEQFFLFVVFSGPPKTTVNLRQQESVKEMFV